MARYEKIMEALENMNTSELVAIWNEYCSENRYDDDIVYPMDEFDSIMEGRTPLDIARTCFYGDFCPADDYFYFNGYGNVVSFDYYAEENSIIDIEAIARYVDEDEDALYNDELEDILNEEEE